MVKDNILIYLAQIMTGNGKMIYKMGIILIISYGEETWKEGSKYQGEYL